MASRATRRPAPPLEHRILVTVTLCLLAFGAVMVYSASSPTGVLSGSSYGTGEFFTYLLAAALGLVAMRICERRGVELLSERVVKLLLFGSFALLLAVMVTGLGLDLGGARRWFAVGAGSLLLATNFFAGSESGSLGNASATSALELVLLLYIVMTLAGPTQYDLTWIVVVILTFFAFVPVLVALVFTLWAATRTSTAKP